MFDLLRIDVGLAKLLEMFPDNAKRSQCASDSIRCDLVWTLLVALTLLYSTRSGYHVAIELLFHHWGSLVCRRKSRRSFYCHAGQ